MKAGEHVAVVWARSWSWLRVTDMDELVGRFSLGSRFPQYLSELDGSAVEIP